MQDALASLPGWAPTALHALGGTMAAVPFVAYAVRARRAGTWSFVAGSPSWRSAVGLLLVCGALGGVLGAAGVLTQDAQRLDGQHGLLFAPETLEDTAWLAQREHPLPRDTDVDDAVWIELQSRYGVNVDGVLGGSLTFPDVGGPLPVSVLSGEPARTGAECELTYDDARADALAGRDVDWLHHDPASAIADLADVYALVCDGEELTPQDALLGVAPQTEVTERTWPAVRAPRHLLGGALAGVGAAGAVLFALYVKGKGRHLLLEAPDQTDELRAAAVAEQRRLMVADDDEGDRVVAYLRRVAAEDGGGEGWSDDDADGRSIRDALADVADVELFRMMYEDEDELLAYLVDTGRAPAALLDGPRLIDQHVKGALLSAAVLLAVVPAAWMLSLLGSDDVQFRYEEVVSAAGAEAYRQHYEGLGLTVDLPEEERTALDPGSFYALTDATRGDEWCSGRLVNGFALMRCGPDADDRVWL